MKNTKLTDWFHACNIADLVVGAPYEGRGAIYIYRGSKTHVVSTVLQFSQRIYASDIRRVPALQSFGYSLADTRGVDVDGNTYPDIAVGAYESDSVVLLRTRPIVNIVTRLSNLPDKVNPANTSCFDGSPYNCFNVTTCLRFTAEPKEK